MPKTMHALPGSARDIAELQRQEANTAMMTHTIKWRRGIATTTTPPCLNAQTRRSTDGCRRCIDPQKLRLPFECNRTPRPSRDESENRMRRLNAPSALCPHVRRFGGRRGSEFAISGATLRRTQSRRAIVTMARRHEGHAKDWARCHWHALATDGAAVSCSLPLSELSALPDAAVPHAHGERLPECEVDWSALAGKPDRE